MIAAFDRSASHRPARATILLAAAVTGLVMLALVYLAAVAPRGVPLLPYYYVNAQFRDAENIRILSTVQIAGRRVGQVSDITYDHGLARLKLQMLPGNAEADLGGHRADPGQEPDRRQVRRDHSAHLGHRRWRATRRCRCRRPRRRSTPRRCCRGSTRPRAGTSSGSLIGLGQGFLGRGQGINETLPLATGVLTNLDELSQAVLALPGAASNFAPSADSLAGAYDPVRQQLGAGFRPQADVLNDFTAQRPSIESTLDVAPGALAALRSGLAQSDPLLEQTAGFARATIGFTQPAPAALKAATALLRTAVPSLQQTLPLLRSVGNAVDPTDALLARVDPVIAPSIRVLLGQIRPLGNLAARQCDFLNQTVNWRSAMAWGVPANYDPISHLSTPEPGLGSNINSFRVLALPETSSETLNADAPGSFPHGVDAYPAPCAAPSQVNR